MQFTFDLISDLHIDTWPVEFNWTGCATSQHCVVLGDICSDRTKLYHTLKHLGKCYQAVFYIDGNDEHIDYGEDLGASYKDLVHEISKLHNVVYLQDNVVVINGVAILGTNGWWGFDFDPNIDIDAVKEWWCDRYYLSQTNFEIIRKASEIDATYIASSIKRLQTHQDVKKIVVVTHTVPAPNLIAHDISLVNNYKFNVMGNSDMLKALAADTENKIHTWCFGHYHGKVDQTRAGIRFVNNCRGRGQTPWSQYVYHPLRITIDA
jgi:predicted phosphodiesterase